MEIPPEEEIGGALTHAGVHLTPEGVLKVKEGIAAALTSQGDSKKIQALEVGLSHQSPQTLRP